MNTRRSSFVIRHSSFPALLAALGGFLLPWQTVWILRAGMLGGVPWPLATIGLYASDVVLLIAAVVGVVRMRRGGDLPLTPPLPAGRGEMASISPPPGRGSERGRGSRRLLIALALLVIVVIINVQISADPALSAAGWVRVVLFLIALAGLPAWSERARRAFLNGFLVAMLGHVVLGFLQFATGHGFASSLLGTAAHAAFVRGDSVLETLDGRWLRAYGGFPHPNVFGTALLVAMLVLARRPVRSFIIHHSSFIILTFALVLSFSRAAWLGFVILLFVLARSRAAPEKDGRLKLEHAEDAGASRWSARSLAGIGAIAFVAFLIALWPFVAPRFTGSTPNEQRSLSERGRGLEAAIAFGSAPLFFGVGLHAMPRVLWDLRPYLREHTVTPWTWAQPTHNVPLLAIAEIGPIGAFVLVLVLVMLFRMRPSYALRLTPYSPIWLALAPSLLFDHHLWSLPIGLALLFALAVAIPHAERLPPVSTT